ncbi:diacylglycerol kinase zeta-like isoform X2 [Arapaima gigas]
MEQPRDREVPACSGGTPLPPAEDPDGSTSSSSSNSDLPSCLPPEGERPAGGRRCGAKTFTGLRLFGRRDLGKQSGLRRPLTLSPPGLRAPRSCIRVSANPYLYFRLPPSPQ